MYSTPTGIHSKSSIKASDGTAHHQGSGGDKRSWSGFGIDLRLPRAGTKPIPETKACRETMVDVHLHEIERMIWLGEQRGCLTDWLTQRWVIATGRKISLTEYPWLEGPIGKTRAPAQPGFPSNCYSDPYPVRIATEYQIQDFDVFSIGLETRCPVGAKPSVEI
jgi:hypothetical protein